MRCYTLRDGQYVDCLSLENASLAWTAGAMVSTGPDLLKFARAVFEGGLVPPGLRQAELDFQPMENWGDYGLGVTRQGAGAAERWGHTGRTVGFSTALWYYPADGSVVAVLANLQRADTARLADEVHALLQL